MKHKIKIVILMATLIFTFLIVSSVMAETIQWNDNSAKTSESTEWANWKTRWKTVKNDYEQICLTPGKTEAQLNFAWYSKKDNQAKVRISTSKDMKNPISYKGKSSKYKKLMGTTYYTNKTTANKLKNNTVYYYQYYKDGAWSKSYQYVTRDPESFSLLYVGDPQIGASVGQIIIDTDIILTGAAAARNDAYSWNTTLKSALKRTPNLSFIISAGDQINNVVSDGSAKNNLQQEMEYAGFLSPKIMKSVPIATTIGNHDFQTANYKKHFNNPNSFTEETSAVEAGNGYYYSYGKALFIVLDTNNYNCADHAALLKQAVDANPEAIWRIVTFHHDIYGSGSKHSDSQGMILRTQLTKLMDQYDIDVVLQGHDHTYSRSYQLKGDGRSHTFYDASIDLTDSVVKKEFLKQNRCYTIVDKSSGTVTDPKGVLYMEANSSTGSKFYALASTKYDYIAAKSQTHRPTYSIIDITDAEFTINTYDVSSGNKIDESYTIRKSIK